MGHSLKMSQKALEAIVERAVTWPEHAQEELVRVASEIEAELELGTYRANASELRGIDRGLRDAADGKFATDGEVEAVFDKYRPR
jgi:predicted transcriptional regulator